MRDIVLEENLLGGTTPKDDVPCDWCGRLYDGLGYVDEYLADKFPDYYMACDRCLAELDL